MFKTQVNTPDRAKRRAKKRDENRRRPRFGSIEDAAEYLGISRAHFYLYVLPRVRTMKSTSCETFDCLRRLTKLKLRWPTPMGTHYL